MRPRNLVPGAVVGVILFTFFVPVIRFDTNVSPPCARLALPCALTIATPIDGHAVFWSITAYFFGIGTFLVAYTYYGFVL